LVIASVIGGIRSGKRIEARPEIYVLFLFFQARGSRRQSET
jgi:hypothetical protein